MVICHQCMGSLSGGNLWFKEVWNFFGCLFFMVPPKKLLHFYINIKPPFKWQVYFWSTILDRLNYFFWREMTHDRHKWSKTPSGGQFMYCQFPHKYVWMHYVVWSQKGFNGTLCGDQIICCKSPNTPQTTVNCILPSSGPVTGCACMVLIWHWASWPCWVCAAHLIGQKSGASCKTLCTLCFYLLFTHVGLFYKVPHADPACPA